MKLSESKNNNVFCCFSQYRAVENENEGAGQNHARMTAYRVVQTLYTLAKLDAILCAQSAISMRLL